MDYLEENSYLRASQLRPPSQIPTPGRGLTEISESQSNARSKPVSKMAPPASLKHRLGSVYNEPEPKQRKTLAERAGESKSIAAPPPPRPAVKGQSIVGVARNTSFSSSISSHSRTASASSRNTSNGSFASSVGPGSRPKSAYGRPFAQSTTTRPTSIATPRPTSSMEHHESEDDLPSQGRRKGMLPLPSNASSFQSSQTYSTIKCRKLRAPHSMQSLRSQHSPTKQRDISVSTAMSKLQINETQRHAPEPQASSTTMQPPSTPFLRHTSTITTGLRNLRIDSTESALVLFEPPGDSLVAPKTPSHIPVLCKAETPTPSLVTPCKTPKPLLQNTPYLTKDSNIPAFVAWDVRGRLEDMEAMYEDLKGKFSGTNLEGNRLEEAVRLFKTRISELEMIRAQITSTNESLQATLEAARQKYDALQDRLLITTTTLDDQVRAHRIEIDDAQREHRKEVDQLRRTSSDEVERLLRLHREEVRELERRSSTEIEDRLREMERRNNAELEQERSRRLREVQDLESRISSEHSQLDLALQKKDLEIRGMRGELEDVRGELDREQTLKGNAQKSLSDLRETMQQTGTETSSTIQKLESTISSLSAKIHFLESGSKAQSDSFADMESRLQEALESARVSKTKLIKEESLRRILFNQVQELKGNIRVMCRVRPAPANGPDGDVAKIGYPDVEKESKELEIKGKEEKSSLGTVTRKTHAFTFDRVFGPESQNQEVFEEISQLVQSALDGYNVCIFCYGQTGSGKTHTMSSADGMIPRATHQIYETATNLKEKGWTYTMEGCFIEVYNEEIHDLLGNSKDSDKKKHDIRHDEQKKQTVVTGLNTVTLDSPHTVESILKQAAANRSVAATKSNERSSRSHSVFILKLVGRNSTTGETSEGTLNLVDLAGSERLKQSGAEGDRMKETQNINKSLSCLGDVIGALGQGKEGAHIPYRNSKLTYLLQYSLGGNSKTLMFVMASPLEAHLSETLTSLKFATKVHNTHIGTAKKSTKVRGSES